MSDPDTKRKPGRPRKVTPPATISPAPEPRQRPAMYEPGEVPTACMKCRSAESTILNTWIAARVRFRRRRCICGQHWVSRVRV